MSGKFWGAGGERGRGAVKNAETVAGIQRAERQPAYLARQEAGIPVLTDEEQQTVAASGSGEGFFSPFKGGVDPTLKGNKSSALAAIPQYDTSANSAYRQQMSLRKVRANKL